MKIGFPRSDEHLKSPAQDMSPYLGQLVTLDFEEGSSGAQPFGALHFKGNLKYFETLRKQQDRK